MSKQNRKRFINSIKALSLATIFLGGVERKSVVNAQVADNANSVINKVNSIGEEVVLATLTTKTTAYPTIELNDSIANYRTIRLMFGSNSPSFPQCGQYGSTSDMSVDRFRKAEKMMLHISTYSAWIGAQYVSDTQVKYEFGSSLSYGVGYILGVK